MALANRLARSIMSATGNKPKVTVCVVTYNHERYIRQCLQSIVDQKTDFDFEIIIGEDCSLDETRKIINEFKTNYSNKILTIFHEKNIGAKENYKSVHFKANSDYISHIDGDDYWLPGKLQAQVDFLTNNPNCSAVFTNAHVVSDLGDHIGIFSNGVQKYIDTEKLIRSGNFLTHSSIMYRTKYREHMIPLTDDFVDYLLYVRLAQRGALGFIDENLVTYRHKSSTSIVASANHKVRELIWKALQAVDLPSTQSQIVFNAKIHFVTSSILHELVHGDNKYISKWLSIGRDTIIEHRELSLRYKSFHIIRTAAEIIISRISNRFRSKNNSNIFYRK